MYKSGFLPMRHYFNFATKHIRKILLMKYFYFPIVLLLLITACKKNKNEVPVIVFEVSKITVNGALASETSYDAQGRRKEAKNYSYSAAGMALHSITTLEYNNGGQLQVFRFDFVNPVTKDIHREYVYDAQGRVSEVKHHAANIPTYMETRTYQGDKVRIDGKLNNVAAYSYEITFDAKGNVTKEVYDDKTSNDDRLTEYLQYDDKNNNLYIPGSYKNSRNNPLKIKYTYADTGVSENYTETNTYEYNSAGFVTKRTVTTTRVPAEAPYVYEFELVKTK